MPGKSGKSFVPQTQLLEQVTDVLADIQTSLHDKALAFREENTHDPQNFDEFRQVVKSGWAFSWWCGNAECEVKIKEETKATTRCIPFEQPGGSGVCIYCNQPAVEKVYFSRAY
jgi:prolyl-tRNA synthetase